MINYILHLEAPYYQSVQPLHLTNRIEQILSYHSVILEHQQFHIHVL